MWWTWSWPRKKREKMLLKAKRIWYLICFVAIVRDIFFPGCIHTYVYNIHLYVRIRIQYMCLFVSMYMYLDHFICHATWHCTWVPATQFFCIFMCILYLYFFFFIISQYLYLLCVFLWKDSFTSVFIKDGGEEYNISVWPVTMRQLGLSLINRPTLPMDHGTHGWNCPCTSTLQHTQPLYPWTYKPSLPMGGYTLQDCPLYTGLYCEQTTQ